MSIRSDSSVHEDDQEIIGGYEDLESDDEQRNETEGEENGDKEDQNNTTKRTVDPTTKKRVVRNPMINFNTEYLKGVRGICTLEKYFEGFRYHGKGHEKTDIDRIMKRLEHWSHRLFPKLNFDDFLEKTEKLGTKKDLKVFLKKYRSDMITPDSDIIIRDDNEEVQDESEPVDAFDELIAEQIEKQKQATRSHDSSMLSDGKLNMNEQNISDRDARPINDRNLQDFDYTSSQNVNNMEIRADVPAEAKNKSMDLTEHADEMKARIERNRLQAIERRMARRQALEEHNKRKKLEVSENVECKEDSWNRDNEQDIVLENPEDKNGETAKHESTSGDKIIEIPVNTSRTETATGDNSTELSSDIKARIERNRLEAIERRKARLRALEEENRRMKLKVSEKAEDTDKSCSWNNEQNEVSQEKFRE